MRRRLAGGASILSPGEATLTERCRITNATALYSSLVGIRSAQAVGAPPTEMRIEYESPQGNEGDYRTLSITLGEDGRMTGARVRSLFLFGVWGRS